MRLRARLRRPVRSNFVNGPHVATLARRERGRGGARTYVLATCGAAVLVAAASSAIEVYGLASEHLVRLQCWVLTLAGVWCLYSWKLSRGSWLHPSMLLWLAAFAFHGSLAVLEVVGLWGHPLVSSRFSIETISRTLGLATVCLMCLYLGALLGTEPQPTRRIPSRDSGLDVPRARWLAAALLLVSAVPAARVLADSISLVNSSGYFALYQADSAVGFHAAQNVLAQFFVPAAFYVLALSGRNRAWVAVSLACLLAYCAGTLYVGGRSPAAVIIVTTVWVLDRWIFRVPRSVMVAGALFLLAVFSVVAVVRNIPGRERATLDAMSRAFRATDVPVVQSIKEAGGTVFVVAHIIDLVPDIRPFDWGTSYLFAFTAVIPNLFWDVHPLVSHGTPSQWLIQTVDPATARAGGGMGFSFIGEAYWNYGHAGAPFIVLALGFLWGRLCAWGDRDPNSLKIAFLASAVAMSLSLVRNDSTGAIRSLAWYCVPTYVLLRQASLKRPFSRQTSRVTSDDLRQRARFATGPLL